METRRRHRPPDIMPPVRLWLSEAAPADQERLQTSSVRVWPSCTTMDVTPQDLAFLELDRPGDSAMRRHVAGHGCLLRMVAGEGARSPAHRSAPFTWLDDHLAHRRGETVISWGDSASANICSGTSSRWPCSTGRWRRLVPVRSTWPWNDLPPRFLDDLAVQLGLPGCPISCRLDDVAAAYESFTGHTPRDLEFYTVYASLRHAIVMSRWPAARSSSARDGDAS